MYNKQGLLDFVLVYIYRLGDWLRASLLQRRGHHGRRRGVGLAYNIDAHDYNDCSRSGRSAQERASKPG